MKRLLTDPLLHFLFIGGLLFTLFEYISDPAESGEVPIRVSRGEITALAANFSRTWQRQPTDTELAGLIEEKIRDEIAYREAIAMGLDQEDLVIRRRLRMKLELLLEDIAGLSPPTDQELQTFLEQNRDSFQRPARLSLVQVYINAARHGRATGEVIEAVEKELTEIPSGVEPQTVGDPTMLPARLNNSSLDVIARQFGRMFSETIATLEPGKWHGPIRSSYGLHFVYISEKAPALDPKLEEIRSEVAREWSVRQRREFKEQTYQELRARHAVIVETEPPEEPNQP